MILDYAGREYFKRLIVEQDGVIYFVEPRTNYLPAYHGGRLIGVVIVGKIFQQFILWSYPDNASDKEVEIWQMLDRYINVGTVDNRDMMDVLNND